MFKKISFVLIAFFTVSNAVTLDEIIKSLNEKNRDLKAIEKNIEIASQDLKISQNWQNPVLSIGANDIQFDDPFKRDLEAMQAQYIGVSQVIPTGNKLELKKEISNQELKISKLLLEDKKLQLKSKIYELSYTISVLERKYKLLTKYEDNISNLLKLSKVLYENGNMKQSDVLDMNIKLSRVALSKKSLKNLISNLYVNLEKISYLKIKNLELALEPKKITLEQNIENHPKIVSLLENSKKFEQVSKLEIEKKFSDVKVNVAYFQRDEKFQDYANISFSIPLAIYDTEDVNSLKAKLKSNEVKERFENMKVEFSSNLKTLQNNLDNSYEKYLILKESIIPTKESIQKSLESYNSFNQLNPIQNIKNLNELIEFEMQLLDEINNYYQAYSQATYYQNGEKRWNYF